jgi:FAD/FMN-containing dehydrogenase
MDKDRPRTDRLRCERAPAVIRLTNAPLNLYLGAMVDLHAFIDIIKAEFPDDRLTWQKAIPTFHPESAEEAAKLLRLANQHRRKIYITGFGNNVDPQGERFGEVLSIRTDRLNDILELAAEDFYIAVGSGFPLREINEHVRKHKLPLSLPHSLLPYVGSVGGAIAAGLSADLHGHDFPLKKYLLKAEIVTPEGEIITPGSECFKSVSGYDIVKIFANSWGLLGLIVSATFRLVPDELAPDFAGMKMKPIERERFLRALVDSEAPEADYSRRIRSKFDPNGILPIV